MTQLPGNPGLVLFFMFRGNAYRDLEFMIIDDDEFTLKFEILTVSKEFPDSAIQAIQDPVEALKLIIGKIKHPQHNKITIVLLDLYMPVVDGYTLLERINRLKPQNQQLFVYVVSCVLGEDVVKRVIPYDFVCGFIPKPLNSDRLHEVLDIC